jgi:hypothetical protein
MHVFFTLITLSLFGVSIALSNWLASVCCSLVLVLLFCTRFFSNRIVKRAFTDLTPLESTVYAHLQSTLFSIYSNEEPRPKVYLDKSLSPVQMYIFGDQKKLNIIVSESLLEHISPRDFKKLLNQTYDLSKNSYFLSKRHVVAFFLLIVSLGRQVDATLSFFLGIKTKDGEPKALTRKIVYLVARLFKTKSNFKSQNESALKDYSYLSFYHDHPILSPLSIVDMNT